MLIHQSIKIIRYSKNLEYYKIIIKWSSVSLTKIITNKLGESSVINFNRMRWKFTTEKRFPSSWKRSITFQGYKIYGYAARCTTSYPHSDSLHQNRIH